MIRVEGAVKEALPHAMYRVELDDGRRVLAHVAEETRRRVLRVLPGDRVTLEISPFDLGRGRILRREGAESERRMK